MTRKPDDLRADIEATRRGMEATLDRIEDRVAPRRIAKRKADRARSLWSQAKQRVMGAAQGVGDRADELRERAGEATDRAGEVQRRPVEGSPLAVGLVAFGLGALAGSIFPGTRTERRVAGRIASQLAPVGQEGAAAGSDLAESVEDDVEAAADEVTDTARDAVRRVQDEAVDAGGSVREGAREAAGAVQRGAGGPGVGSIDPRPRYEERTVEELLGIAGERDITGRWDMNKDELIAALRESETPTAPGDRSPASAARYEDRTLDELRDLAGERDITGRWDMNKDELIAALRR